MEEQVKEKFDFKKYLPFAIGALIVIIAIILILSLTGGPKKAVKSFISGMNKQNAKKVVNSMDFIGSAAWGYSYDPDDFSKEDYEEFIEEYEEIKDEMDKDDLKESKEDMIDLLKDGFEEQEDEYKSYKIKIEKFKSVKKLGKSLYAVEAKVNLLAKPKDKDDDEIDETETMTFIVYKNKLIYSDGGLL